MTSVANLRVLVVDDNPSIHDDFRRVLTPIVHRAADDLDEFAGAIFGTAAPVAAPVVPGFELEHAMQGQEAREKVADACAEGRPFALAFVDMRMPPGWDGLTTIAKMWEVDPTLHVTICTAHADRSWDDITRSLSSLATRDRWLVLKKPFDKIEASQIAHVMTTKWNLARARAAG